jgi:hypothetical protein
MPATADIGENLNARHKKNQQAAGKEGVAAPAKTPIVKIYTGSAGAPGNLFRDLSYDPCQDLGITVLIINRKPSEFQNH